MKKSEVLWAWLSGYEYIRRGKKIRCFRNGSSMKWILLRGKQDLNFYSHPIDEAMLPCKESSLRCFISTSSKKRTPPVGKITSELLRAPRSRRGLCTDGDQLRIFMRISILTWTPHGWRECRNAKKFLETCRRWRDARKKKEESRDWPSSKKSLFQLFDILKNRGQYMPDFLSGSR